MKRDGETSSVKSQQPFHRGKGAKACTMGL